MQRICTIIAKNYIAFARTLCSSFLEHHPNGKCYVLIIDGIDGYINASEENCEIIRIEELNIPRLTEFCYKYNLTELATAVKPYLIDYLFNSRGMDSILYLDPDILVTHSLNGLYEELTKTDIALTPHLDKDYPDDGLMPDDGHIMRAGIYNLGFIGLRKCDNSDEFLSWWKHKLYDKCVIDTPAGFFVDQKFIDLASVLFPNITIIKDTGYNVAYWNAHSRRIYKKDNIWMCNDGLLYFYHFSNYKPEKPNILSGHQNRFRLEELEGLHELFMIYTNQLKQNDYDATWQWTYDYKRYTNGRIINDAERIAYRKGLPITAVDNPFVWETHSWRIRIPKEKRNIKTFRRYIKNMIKAPFKSLWRKMSSRPS